MLNIKAFKINGSEQFELGENIKLVESKITKTGVQTWIVDPEDILEDVRGKINYMEIEGMNTCLIFDTDLKLAGFSNCFVDSTDACGLEITLVDTDGNECTPSVGEYI